MLCVRTVCVCDTNTKIKGGETYDFSTIRNILYQILVDSKNLFLKSPTISHPLYHSRSVETSITCVDEIR